jgi:hypothetical protein
MSRPVLLAYKPHGEGWRERTFTSEREAWAFVLTLDADVEARFIDTTAHEGYAHALSLIAKLQPNGGTA